MKNLKLIIIAVLLTVLLTSNVSAIQFNNFSGASGRIGNGNGYFSNDAEMFNYSGNRNVYTVTESDFIFIIEPITFALGLSSSQTPIWKGNSPLTFGMVASNGYLYFIDGQGIKKKMSRDTSSVSYANNTGIGQDIVILSSETPISLYEYQQNLYYVSAGNLKYISLTDDLTNTVSGYTSMKPYGLSVGRVNETFTVYTTNGECQTSGSGRYYLYIYKSNAAVQNSLIYVSEILTYNYDACSVIKGTTFLSPDYLYANMYVKKTSYGAYTVELVLSTVNNSIFSTNAYVGSGIEMNGMAFLGGQSNVMLAANSLTTYSTYNFLESGISVEYTAPAALVYDNAVVYSTYSTYYNNSLFNINYNIAFDTDQYDWNINLIEANTLKYSHRIDLINPAGIRIATYPVSNIDCDTFWMSSAIYMLLNPDAVFPCKAGGNFNFQATTPWTNGTYTVKLYEVTTASGVISLLSSDTFDVLNEKGTLAGTNSLEDTKKNLATSAGLDNVLASGWFVPVLIILALGITGAKSAGQPGFVGGYTLGYIITFVAGMIPTWALFVFVITTILMAGFMVGKNIVSSRS